uniref:Uncharacterized protein n=1 Tax=Molossus molossus TaxID=27622 RepID=A0A7J8BYB5_MOLMO|nr:hypothetical protein HJG59_010006 [Molossus molossus]
MVYFAVKKNFVCSLILSLLFIFSFVPLCKNVLEKILLEKMLEMFLPMLCCRSFMLLSLTFKTLIHFKFILAYGVRWWSRFILFAWIWPVSHHHLLYRLSVLHCTFLPPLSKMIDHIDMGLFLISLFCSIVVFLCQYI